ncbi:MAG: hypothetical protein IID18_08865, partial [Nitrospinae bacterium]|nr:hypothetical protein [Nitrospinota bacterium]
DFSGVLERIEDRFPDTEAFERERLSGISQQAQQSTGLQRRNVIANFGGDLQAAGNELERVSFDVGQQSGREANRVGAEAENIKRQQAAGLANIDSALAQAEASDLTTRTLAGGQALLGTSLTGANIFAQMFGQGEALGLQADQFDIGNRLQADIFNQTIPFDQAQISANLQSGQEMQKFQALLAILGLGSNLMGGTIVDSQRACSSSNIDSERFPQEGLLEYSLAQISREKEAIGSVTFKGTNPAEHHRYLSLWNSPVTVRCSRPCSNSSRLTLMSLTIL